MLCLDNAPLTAEAAMQDHYVAPVYLVALDGRVMSEERLDGVYGTGGVEIRIMARLTAGIRATVHDAPLVQKGLIRKERSDDAGEDRLPHAEHAWPLRGHERG